MTEVLQSPSSSSSSSSSLHNFQETNEAFDNEEEDEEEEERVSNALIEEIKKREKDDDQLSLLALLVALFRKSSFWVSRRNDSDKLCGGNNGGMDIGWPTNVQHVAHVTFDRFSGFLGLPVEFELEVPLRAPSARYTMNPCDYIHYTCVCILGVGSVWRIIELYSRFEYLIFGDHFFMGSGFYYYIC